MDFNNDSQANSFQGTDSSNNTVHQPINNNVSDAFSPNSNVDSGNPNPINSTFQDDKKSSGFAIASLVLGILSIVMVCCCFCFPYVNLIFGVLAIIFAIVDRNRPDKTGTSIGGLVCGILGVVLSIMLLIFPKILLFVAKDQMIRAGYNIEDVIKEFNIGEYISGDFSFEEFMSGDFNLEDFDFGKFLKKIVEKASEQ